MSDLEEELFGGNVADSVVRIGTTVRKPATHATPAVEALLAYLHSVGFRSAPQSLGRDDAGRQVLEFVPGPLWSRENQSTTADLRRVGCLIRALHDALSSFRSSAPATWDVITRADGDDLICHNDLAPWNLICSGERWVFIDWDNAAPGTRLWDLAWAAISFPPVEPGCNLLTAAMKIRAIADGYDLQCSQYHRLLQLMVRRSRAASDLLIEGARTNQQPWARLYAEGHDKYWGPVSGYIESNLSVLEEMMVQDCTKEQQQQPNEMS
jgi:Phosphotransferase enzyme family